ncbi:MAG: SDR family NAD(P)-dependent oxidoreductase [Kiloniellaceae bacterium]
MNQTVLIAGCSSSIGRAAAKYFDAEGWNVVETMREPLKAAELGDLPSVLIARLDVQDNVSIQIAVEAGIARFGHLDAVVNNAGTASSDFLRPLATTRRGRSSTSMSLA